TPQNCDCIFILFWFSRLLQRSTVVAVSSPERLCVSRTTECVTDRMEELLCLLVFIAPLSCAATPVRLTMSPNYLQYFKERRFTLNCEGGDGSADWNVIRNTSPGPTRSAMTLPWDTGVYWCESKNGQTSEMQNLTVTAGSVILQTGVALPITEGDDLTLVCVTKKPTKNWSAFYKDGALISSVPTGRLTIRNVAKSDEGVYNCETERDGKSPLSWIAITETMRGEFVSEGPLLESTSPETTTGAFVSGAFARRPSAFVRRPSAFVRRPRAPADPAHSSADPEHPPTQRRAVV
uniref:Ig-like domain-containing protein n=1 Tax=Oreochromis aureus TaxID=47969 RepID=A0AAZ1XX33_OREAU